MKQLFNETEIIGKTIKYVDDDEYIFFISFNDDTFIVFESDYDSRHIEINEFFNTIPTIDNYQDLYKKGIIDELAHNQFEAKKKEQSKSYDEYVKQREIEKLRELKAKYPEI